MILLLPVAAGARVDVQEVELISGMQDDLSLFILSNDLDIDLKREPARFRFILDAETLMATKNYPQTFRMRTYSFGINGEKMIHSDLSQTIKRKNRTKVRFTTEIGTVLGDKDFYFELYDSVGKLVNTYRQTIDFSNFEDQVYDDETIVSADCPAGTFGECHLDYIMEHLDFQMLPKNTNYSNKIKKYNGAYNIVLSVPRSVREQILQGSFNPQLAANNSGNGGSLTGNGDNLGNHIAFMTLNMNDNDIINARLIDADHFNGAALDISGLSKFNSIQIPNGAANGYVLTSDANGNASWKPLLTVLNGDNLGNHVATQDLNMNGHSLVNGDMLVAEVGKFNGQLMFENGATVGYVLTATDANGNSAWQPINTVVNGDDLGNHTAQINLNMNGNSIVNLAALTMPTGANAGFVLTSDVNGLASWQAATGGSTNGDNLGNHTATMNVMMNGFSMYSANGVVTSTLFAGMGDIMDLVVNGSLQYQPGAANGLVLTSDANGNAHWAAVAAGGGNGDNLGNHQATMALGMNGYDILSVNDITAVDITANGVEALGLVANASLQFQAGAANGYILASDANGNASWVPPASFAVNGDDLGNHTATQNLDLATFDVDNVHDLAAQSIHANGSVSLLPHQAANGYVLTSDALGNASWQPAAAGAGNGDDLGNHIADTHLNMNGYDLFSVNGLLAEDAGINGNFAAANILAENTTINGTLIIHPLAAGTNFVLTATGSGVATWQPAATDNLGDHIATTDLQMSGYDIRGVDELYLNGSLAQAAVQNNGGALTINWYQNSNIQAITLDSNATLAFGTTPAKSAELTLIFTQDATGGRTVTFPGSVKWPGGSAPTITGTANSIDIVECFFNDISFEYLCNLRAQDYQ